MEEKPLIKEKTFFQIVTRVNLVWIIILYIYMKSMGQSGAGWI